MAAGMAHTGSYAIVDDLRFSSMPMGIDNEDGAGILKIYPNPATDNIVFQYHIEQAGKVRVQITDMSGKIVAEPYSGSQETGNYKLNIPAGEMAPGIYMITLRHENRVFAEKIIIR